MWTLAYGQDEDRTPTARLRADARGGDGGVREELAAGIGRVLIDAQIAALLGLSKSDSPFVVD
jgi:hypothetical protein